MLNTGLDRVPVLDKRALYLGSKDKKRVACTPDALVVCNERQSIYRYPVARLARIVSSIVVDWSGAALALCMRCGISVAWQDAHGEVIGVAYPKLRSQVGFATALELMVEGTDGALRFQHWLRARRMDIYVRWAHAQTKDRPSTEYEATKRDWVYAGRYPTHLPPALRAVFLAYVSAQLASHGLPPQLWGANSEGIDLDEHLCELLWAEMSLCSGNLTDTVTQNYSVTALFESWVARNAGILLLHINSLQRCAMKALTS